MMWWLVSSSPETSVFGIADRSFKIMKPVWWYITHHKSVCLLNSGICHNGPGWLLLGHCLILKYHVKGTVQRDCISLVLFMIESTWGIGLKYFRFSEYYAKLFEFFKISPVSVTPRESISRGVANPNESLDKFLNWNLARDWSPVSRKPWGVNLPRGANSREWISLGYQTPRWVNSHFLALLHGLL